VQSRLKNLDVALTGCLSFSDVNPIAADPALMKLFTASRTLHFRNEIPVKKTAHQKADAPFLLQ